jgi:signal recognition particle subunit SEC65
METNDKIMKTWIKIYPIYVDKGMKRSEGRKVADEFAVPNPTLKEIFAIVKSINLECSAEDVKNNIFISRNIIPKIG